MFTSYNIWIILSDSVLDADMTNTFKSRLKNTGVVYN